MTRLQRDIMIVSVLEGIVFLMLCTLFVMALIWFTV